MRKAMGIYTNRTPSKVKKEARCGLCRQEGHKRNKCPNRPNRGDGDGSLIP